MCKQSVASIGHICTCFNSSTPIISNCYVVSISWVASVLNIKCTMYTNAGIVWLHLRMQERRMIIYHRHKLLEAILLNWFIPYRVSPYTLAIVALAPLWPAWFPAILSSIAVSARVLNAYSWKTSPGIHSFVFPLSHLSLSGSTHWLWAVHFFVQYFALLLHFV